MSGDRIQLADLHHSRTTQGQRRGAAYFSPAVQVIHSLLRSSQTFPPWLPLSNSGLWPQMFNIWLEAPWRHNRCGTGREEDWRVVPFPVIHTSTDEDRLWSGSFKELVLFVHTGVKGSGKSETANGSGEVLEGTSCGSCSLQWFSPVNKQHSALLKWFHTCQGSWRRNNRKRTLSPPSKYSEKVYTHKTLQMLDAKVKSTQWAQTPAKAENLPQM